MPTRMTAPQHEEAALMLIGRYVQQYCNGASDETDYAPEDFAAIQDAISRHQRRWARRRTTLRRRIQQEELGHA